MPNTINDLWGPISTNIKRQATIPAYKTWVSQIRAISQNSEELILEAPNSFVADWLKDNYLDIIKDSLKESVGAVKVKFTIGNNGKNGNGQLNLDIDEAKMPVKQVQRRRGLDPKFSFDTFVIADSNRFAHAAAQAVAEKPSASYNPLFIYGGVGLGKTHLLQAIAFYIIEHYPHLKVKYVSSEKFTNDFIKSIGDKDKINGFHKKYRSNDVLLVDDIQFLEKKEQTQNEFFHTFNTLYIAGKQIIISSDRPPRDLATLEDRLKSRFNSGLITDIQQPELETRMAILFRKANTENINIPGDVVEFIASNIKSNIRELEGALTRVAAYSSIYKLPINLELAKQVLGDIISQQKLIHITIDRIMKCVAEFFSLTIDDLKSSKRAQNIVYPRQIAMYLSRELTDHSLPVIGSFFGNRDHTTVIHANNKIQKLIKEHRKCFMEVQQIINLIKQSI